MTETESSRLIAETLILDGEATKGPWDYMACPGTPMLEPFYCGVPPTDIPARYVANWIIANTLRCTTANAQLIVHNRTSAPRLARMLQVAIESINHMATLQDRYTTEARDDALAEIEKIAKEEA